MGATFIALQGFDLVAAVAGEVRRPARNVPRAMLLSLAIALAIYLPLLTVIVIAGAPGSTITDLARAAPETVVAAAAEAFVGPAGYWLVVAAAILAMLSALAANLYAASRVAMAMARDHTLPDALARLNRWNVPGQAIAVTTIIGVALLIVVPDVAAAGSAASLIFLVTFALAHWIAILVRQRSGRRPAPFRVPLFPLVPVVGGLACVGLAAFQGIAVPRAGIIAVTWLALGAGAFAILFARRARLVDAAAAMHDPELLRLRGRAPLVLVPIANPETAPALVRLADACTPPGVGRILMLSVIIAPEDWAPDTDPEPLERTQAVLGQAIAAAATEGVPVEAVTTIGAEPWGTIAQVAHTHRCESVLLGMSRLCPDGNAAPLEQLAGLMECHVLALQAPPGWDIDRVERLLVPIAGGVMHQRVLARLLGSLRRSSAVREVTFLRVVPVGTPRPRIRQLEASLRRLGRDLWPGATTPQVVAAGDPAAAVIEAASAHDLVILGGQHHLPAQRLVGPFVTRVAEAAPCPILLINRGRVERRGWGRR